MEKSLFEQMGGTYHQENDYFRPDLSVPELPAIGVWGQRRKRYLKEHRQALYMALLLSDKLSDHLSEVDKQAEAMLSQLIKRIAEQEGITEQLKADHQMEWVGQMNSARNRAEEIILQRVNLYLNIRKLRNVVQTMFLSFFVCQLSASFGADC